MSLTFNGLNGLSFGDGSSQNTSASGFGFKNRIINGDMRFDQRYAGSSVTPSNGLYIIDRWSPQFSQASKISVQQVTDAPPGFSYSSKITSLSSYSVVTGDYFLYRQHIEGYNSADFAFGTSYASNIAISFWAKSSLTGNFSVSVYNNDGTRSYPTLYTINTANTWEYKTIIIPGSTSGTWGITNGIGVSLAFGLGGGSTFSSIANAWNISGSWTPHAIGATSLVGTSGATLQIAGVQLEKSATATAFDYRSYTTDLHLCQRYFEMSYDTGTKPGVATNTLQQGAIGMGCYSNTMGAYHRAGSGVTFSVKKRGGPTVTLYAPGTGTAGRATQGDGGTDITGVSAQQASQSGFNVASPTGFTTGYNTIFIHYTAEAEL